MKRKYSLLLMLLLGVSLVGCGKSASSESSPISNISSSQTDTSSSSSLSSADDVKPTTLLDIGDDAFYDTSLSLSGMMLDITVGVGEVLTTGYDYPATITEKKNSRLTLSFSEEGIVEFEEGSNYGNYTIHCLKAGGTIVTIKNADDNDFLLARFVVNVRDPLSTEQLPVFISEDVNIYYADIKGGYDDYNLLFTSETEGTFTAKEGDTVYDDIDFTYEVTGTAKLDNIHSYQVAITVDDPQTAEINVTEAYISLNGYTIFLYDSTGFIGHFVAQF